MFVSHSLDDVPDYVQGYHPEFGHLLDNGNLLVPVSGMTQEGERVDGRIEIASDHPNYAAWLNAMRNSDNILHARKEERNREREERRRQSRERRAVEDESP